PTPSAPSGTNCSGTTPPGGTRCTRSSAPAGRTGTFRQATAERSGDTVPHPYNRRDLIGHWGTRQQRTGRRGTHACCRGKRVHPQSYPVILPDTLLHRASEEALAAGYERGGERRRAQILHEMDRRDAADKHREQAAKERQVKAFHRRQERHEEADRLFFEAE